MKFYAVRKGESENNVSPFEIEIVFKDDDLNNDDVTEIKNFILEMYDCDYVMTEK